MKTWRCLSILMSTLAIFGVILAVPATASAAPRYAHYVIFATNRVPILNINEAGTLVVDVTSGNPSSFAFDWTFRGTTSGSPAVASGTGSGSGNANNLTINLDTISQWSVPGFPEPETGKTAFLSRSGFGFFSSLYFLTLNDFPNFPHPIVAGVPLLVFPGVRGNLTMGNHLLFESSAGSGSTVFGNLPGSRHRGKRSIFPFMHSF